MLLKLTYIGCALLFLLIIGLFWSPLSTTQVSAGFTPTPDSPTPPPPPPPPPPPLPSQDDDPGDDDPCKQGAIIGTVTDLCTGQPGAGIQVVINGSIVTTDGEGHYSLTGLTPGQYNVTLQLPGGQVPAQTSRSVDLGCQTSLSVDPNYYSCQLPTPTPIPPPHLPETGGTNRTIGIMPLLLICLGLGLTALANRFGRQELG